MSVSAAAVKQLRDKTGIGMMDCKKALVEVDGDMEKAVDLLRTRGMAAADKRIGRAAGEGFIGSYIHANGKIGVIVELNCETDFVARNEEFRALARDLSMQIAATNPLAVSTDDVDPEVVARERAIYSEQVKDKPANIIEKIVDGKVKKFFDENCLLEQQFVKDTDRTIGELVKTFAGKIGENVSVKRFQRFAVGEDVS